MAGALAHAGPSLGPVPLEFLFFACVLLGVALLYFLKRSNKIFIRLPMYSRHEKRIVLR